MHASATAAQLYRVFQVKHFVEDDVVDYVAGNLGTVENPANDDGVVGGVIVAEAVAGVIAAPGELGASQESMEEPAIQIFENFFQVIVVTPGGVDVLASAHLADQACLGGDVMAGDIAAIAGALDAVDGLAVELGEQDVRDRLQHGFGCAFEEVGEADVEFSLSQADRVIDRNEGVEPDVHVRNRRARTKLAVGLVEDFLQFRGHLGARVA